MGWIDWTAGRGLLRGLFLSCSLHWKAGGGMLMAGWCGGLAVAGSSGWWRWVNASQWVSEWILFRERFSG